jgi:hypothetical protein
LSSFFINDRLVHVARKEDLLLVFPHAQRTGGSSTMRGVILTAAYGENRIYHRFHVPLAKRWRTITDADVHGFCVYTDMTNYHRIKLQRPYVAIALLRHPVYRAASLYRFIRNKTDHALHELATRCAIEDFYPRASDINPRYFRNLQCRRICGRTDARAALEMIRSDFLAVGFTSHLAEYARALGSLLGWPDIPLATVLPDEERYASLVTPNFREMVLKDNREDLALYEAVVSGTLSRPAALRETVSKTAARVRAQAADLRRKVTRRLARWQSR